MSSNREFEGRPPLVDVEWHQEMGRIATGRSLSDGEEIDSPFNFDTDGTPSESQLDYVDRLQIALSKKRATRNMGRGRRF